MTRDFRVRTVFAAERFVFEKDEVPSIQFVAAQNDTTLNHPKPSTVSSDGCPDPNGGRDIVREISSIRERWDMLEHPDTTAIRVSFIHLRGYETPGETTRFLRNPSPNCFPLSLCESRIAIYPEFGCFFEKGVPIVPVHNTEI